MEFPTLERHVSNPFSQVETNVIHFGICSLPLELRIRAFTEPLYLFSAF